MLEIITAYKTSNGIYLNKDEAEKNRAHSTWKGRPVVEPVQETYLLRLVKGNDTTYFEAKPVQVVK